MKSKYALKEHEHDKIEDTLINHFNALLLIMVIGGLLFLCTFGLFLYKDYKLDNLEAQYEEEELIQEECEGGFFHTWDGRYCLSSIEQECWEREFVIVVCKFNNQSTNSNIQSASPIEYAGELNEFLFNYFKDKGCRIYDVLDDYKTICSEDGR